MARFGIRSNRERKRLESFHMASNQMDSSIPMGEKTRRMVKEESKREKVAEDRKI
jgi:hypothetical protein